MGKRASIEKRAARYQLERVLLESLEAGAILATALVAPNVVGALRKVDPHWASKRDPRRRIREALYRLNRRGLVTVDQSEKRRRVHLTDAGRQLLNALEANDVRIRRPLRWDGRWRVVMFDIEEKHRTSRNAIRRSLARLGLYRLQDSVWVHPYDCEELVALIRTEYRAGQRVLYLVADALEGDEAIRRHFGLRQ